MVSLIVTKELECCKWGLTRKLRIRTTSERTRDSAHEFKFVIFACSAKGELKLGVRSCLDLKTDSLSHQLLWHVNDSLGARPVDGGVVRAKRSGAKSRLELSVEEDKAEVRMLPLVRK
jgi:hypothetical protein